MTDPFEAEIQPLAYPYLEEVLPGFHRARDLIKGAGDRMQVLGFVGEKQEFYRFANRLRLAACFGGLHLKGFTEETATGYDALTQIFCKRHRWFRLLTFEGSGRQAAMGRCQASIPATAAGVTSLI
ncbi:hypothetical protein [Verrucomicrobium sp. BvORR106]|uniref:hypothetical protein n=1 Tax=Verrucomicrobium sp. BvORR106 TaxID=1403819 RepID=UPI00056F3D88|nr:hypothetical protein [Verrucomicrobium sp. BvORR106]